jgi:hypothetical protein
VDVEALRARKLTVQLTIGPTALELVDLSEVSMQTNGPPRPT